jgi:flagellar M-ring protein FliF
VTELLEPVVGRDNLRATVTAEVDFSQIESTSEQFRPNQGNEPAAVRSQSTSEANTARAPHARPACPAPRATSRRCRPPRRSTAQASRCRRAGVARRVPPAAPGAKRPRNYEVDKTVHDDAQRRRHVSSA